MERQRTPMKSNPCRRLEYWGDFLPLPDPVCAYLAACFDARRLES